MVLYIHSFWTSLSVGLERQAVLAVKKDVFFITMRAERRRLNWRANGLFL